MPFSSPLIQVSCELPGLLLHSIAARTCDSVGRALTAFPTVFAGFRVGFKPVASKVRRSKVSFAQWILHVSVCLCYWRGDAHLHFLLTTCLGPRPPRPHSCEPSRSHLAAWRSMSGSVSARQVGSSWVPSHQAPSTTYVCCLALLVCAGPRAEL